MLLSSKQITNDNLEMNMMKNDIGETVAYVGMQGSIARCVAMYPSYIKEIAARIANCESHSLIMDELEQKFSGIELQSMKPIVVILVEFGYDHLSQYYM